MTDLLDSSVLIAIGSSAHVHHGAAMAWFAAQDGPFATTPITEGALIRLLMRSGGGLDEAIAVLAAIRSHARHTFWPDDLPYDASVLRKVTGHAGVTDAYLVALARAQGGRVVTFDRALAATYPDVTERIEIPQG